jgi:hypothetical protein
MSNEIQTGIAEPASNAVESNMSGAEFIARRLGQLAKPPVEKPEEKPVEPEAQPSAEAEEPKAAEPKEDVLSKLPDLGELSENEINELAQKLNSRAVARYGELTAKRKQAEEQIAALQAELAKRSQGDPLSTPKVENNPFAEIKELPALQAKAKEIDEVIEWAEDQLFNNDHLGHDDVIAEVNGKEMTKAQVRAALSNARKARNKFLPAQLAEVQAQEARVHQRKAFEDKARQELNWLDGEDNDTRKQYEAIMNDPRLRDLEKAAPDIAPQLPYILAHAANSIYGRKLITETPKPKLTPPSTLTGNAAQSERPEARKSKEAEEVRKRFYETGSAKDFVALRALQLSKR